MDERGIEKAMWYWLVGELPSEGVKKLVMNESVTASEIHKGMDKTAHVGDAMELRAVFSAAEDGNEETKRKVFEAKSMTDHNGAIPGFKYKGRPINNIEEKFELLKVNPLDPLETGAGALGSVLQFPVTDPSVWLNFDSPGLNLSPKI